jgi:RimJ/RimL family protein N-acetyltransferase
MTPEDAERVGAWRYRDGWAAYDLPSARPILDALSDYHAVVAGNDLVGFCCIGEAARIAGLVEYDGVLDLGLGMDPNLVGEGRGPVFGNAVLRYLAHRHPGRSIRAVVQSWNRRSLRLTRRLGFEEVGDLTAVQGGKSVTYRIVVRPADSLLQ